MKFIKILHYVEKSFVDLPSFVILMSDNKQYISNGPVWIENNEENIQELVTKYDCKKYIDELLLSDSIELSEVTDISYMFQGSQLSYLSKELRDVIDKLTNTEIVRFPI